MDDLSLLEALRDPRMRHAVLVHAPIALSGLGVLLSLAALVARRNHTLRWTAVVAYALLCGTAVLAERSGEAAEEQIRVILPAAVDETLEDHERMAQKVWIIAAATAGLLALSAIPRPKPRAIFATVGLVAGVGLAGWLALTAHHGGSLVYRHGVGTPGGVAAATPATDGPPTTDADAADPRLAHFRANVRPVLEQQCLGCHSPGRKGPAGKLDQTTMAGLLAGGMSGPAVVPGRPDESWLLLAVKGEVEDLLMPPGDDPLPPEAIAMLEQWVRDGAVWEPITLPERPEEETPAAPEGEAAQ
ncbi:MAG: c-type cytochrome domain-containing protein [Planctomycetota bacterium]|jgi:uncharacterized membrane protein